MKRHKIRFIAAFLMMSRLCFGQNEPLFWQNPIREELNVFGVKDFFLHREKETYYLVGTQYKNPFEQKTGISLYQSNNIRQWKAVAQILDTKDISKKSWYLDIFNAPEIHSYKNKYYLIFNGGNSAINPYKKTGFGIAVCDKIDGKYTILNPKKALFDCNHATLVFDEKQQPFVVYEMDGRFYSVGIDLEKGITRGVHKEFLGPTEMGQDYKYLDVPQFFVKNGQYHLIFSQFYGGYVVKVFHYKANSLFGTYKPVENEPLYTWLEVEADEQVKATYPSKNGFAPPTQVIFSNQIVELQKDQFAMVYHSSEKYSEPYLCIDAFTWRGDSIKINYPKAAFQGLNLTTITRFIATHGYENCLEIKNQEVRVVIEPNLGGRVLIYEKNGKNILYVDSTKNGWTFKKNGMTQPSAGRFDIGPEATTPKRNATWVGAWTPEIIDNQSVKITSAIDSVAGIQMVRTFSLDAFSSHLTCTQTVTNVSKKDIRGNHWGRTFAVGGGISLVPKNPNSRFPKGYCIYRPPFNGIDFKPADEPNVAVREGIIEIKNTPSEPKFVMDNTEGWLSYIAPNNLLFIKKYPIYPNRPYGEVSAATSSIWYFKDTMVEIEPIGPQEILKTGESFSFTEDWWLFEYDFPKDRNLNLSKFKQLLDTIK